MRQFILIASFVVLAGIMLNANPFNGETVAPMDLLSNRPGWHSLKLDIEHIHPERTDVVDSRLPSWMFMKHEIRNGRIPIWNPTRTGGTPGIQTFTRSAFSPAFLSFCLFESDALGFYVSHIVNILIALCGTYLFLRKIVDPVASYFGAMVYTFCGFNAAWFFWPHFSTSIWIPWLLYCGINCLQSMQIKYLVGLSIASLMLILGGFPMVTVFGYLALGVLAVSYYWHQHIPFKKILLQVTVLGIFLFASFLIAAPVIYPFKEILGFSSRLAERSGGTCFSIKDLTLLFKPYMDKLPTVEKTMYVGLVPLGLSFVAITFSILKRKTQILFGILLLAVSVTIAFELIHGDIIRLIPTFGNNPWNRIVVLTGLAFAYLSAIGLAEMGKVIKNKKIYYTIAIVLIGVQFFDTKNLFNKFNNSVPNASFYGSTRTIKHVQNKKEPFQYVIADQDFQSAGTLSAYGINEWFSHNLRSAREREQLKKLVKSPFRSPTMANFEARKINFTQPLMDKMNVKFILSASGIIREQTRIFRSDALSKPIAPLPNNYLGITFTLEKQIPFDAIELLFGTVHAEHAPADVILDLYRGIDDSGELIERSTISKSIVTDNRWAMFDFKKNSALVPGIYHLKLSLTDPEVKGRLTVWSYAAKDASVGTLFKNESANVIVNGRRTPLHFNMIFSKVVPIGSNWIKHQFEEDVSLYENMNVKGSAYWVAELSNKSELNYDEVTIVDYKYNDITLEYKADSPGWVVIPMRNYPGWTAYVNNIKKSHSLYYGILPAVPVDGKSVIEFRYKQSNLYKLLGVSIISSLFLLVVFVFFSRKRIFSA